MKIDLLDADDLETYIQTEKLDFCGCGSPVDALNYLLPILRWFKAKGDVIEKNGDTSAVWEYVETLFKSEGEKYFVYYYLCQQEITEHGGSVPGWLTGKGEELLELLEKWHAKTNSEAS